MSRKEEQNIEEERKINSLFDYVGLNRREYELLMESKIPGDYNKIKLGRIK